MKKYFFLIMLTTFSMLLIGCTSSSPTCSPNDTETCTLPFSGESLKDTADHVLQLIKANDFPTLSTFVGPAGVRFSPYEYVNLTGDVVFTSGQLYHALAFSRLFQRGSYDGSGEPIDLGFGQYFAKFVYDVDFTQAPEVYYNQPFQRGNTINTIFDVYTGKSIVEYHFPGIDKQYEGMDRRSLYLVFDQIDGKWYLLGIIHGQWTI